MMFPNLGELQKMGEEAGNVLAQIAEALTRLADIEYARLRDNEECPYVFPFGSAPQEGQGAKHCMLTAGHRGFHL